MAIRLTITTDGDPGSEYVRSFMQDSIVFGRSRSADVCLPAMAVSTRHAEIKLVDGDYVIVDLDSLNGTSVNDKPVLAFRNRILKNGDTITIASFNIGFQTGVPGSVSESRDTAVQQARDILDNVLARSGQSLETNSLYVMTGPSRGIRLELPKGSSKLILGRGKGVDFFLDDPDVSRQHAEVVIEEAGVFIRDLKSCNGIRVDGKRVDAVKLELGDQFTLGSSTIVLEHPAEKSLGLIFEAPEEDTSSFVLLKERASKPDFDTYAGDEASPAEGSGSAVSDVRGMFGDDKVDDISAPSTQSPKPEIGPADPLVASEDNSRITGKHPLSKRTGNHPVGGSQQRTDIGLIIVGALILIATVAGLVYLFH